LPSALKILALPSGMPFFMYPHFLASLSEVSTASAPVFMGNTIS
jgi:hypothetical protein